MSLLLILAAAVSGLLMRQVIDAVVILAIVFLNAVVGVVQKGKAIRALDALRVLEQPSTLAVRDGRPRRIPVRELVPGTW